MNHEEKILEMLAAMQETMTAMQDRQDRTEQMLAGMQSEMKDIHKKLDETNERLDDLIESHEETRDGVNKLLEWSERASSVLELPLPKII